ncbi:hypothetical protein NLJ89_g12214 [Agrocybe chaxingu]|uniref:Uncharacterized protein n=1 Tax=Agrocybe chaxingu TaxID=84603 RepID=A0A9W8JQX6_9AGAR|nr:hypothetical protein NLJ89_g12214 [Agrocybe chaxingu]
MYTRADDIWEQSNEFKKAFSVDVSIEFTLDEHRAKFKANLWNRSTHEEARLELPSGGHQHPPAQPDDSEEYEDFEENDCPDNPETEKKRWSGEKPKIKRRKEDEDDKALNMLEICIPRRATR